jgi:hypothetical protein
MLLLLPLLNRRSSVLRRRWLLLLLLLLLLVQGLHTTLQQCRHRHTALVFGALRTHGSVL